MSQSDPTLGGADAPPRELDAVVVGAGFAGMYMLHRLRKLGLSVQVYEIGDGVGGTWYWNRYPGARCDIESMEYSYQFDDELQQEWSWQERYAPQPEILAYANHVADRYDLRRDIHFETRVESAHFDEETQRWRVTTDRGEPVAARYCIMATGCLSATNIPDFPGRDSFAGDTYHTGRWPHEGVDFSGKRVGIIGTGSSAIQSIPLIAEQAEHLSVFQRTPAYTVPAHNGPLSPEHEARIKAEYRAFRLRNRQQIFGAFADVEDRGGSALTADPEERQRKFERFWEYGGLIFLAAYGDMILDRSSNELAADFVREKIRSIVRDPEVAERLSPRTVLGCKRLCADTNYYATYNRPNVELIDVSAAPIEKITPHGIVTGGREYRVDSIVFATGYDAMTGALTRIDVRGRKGLPLTEKWAAGPRTYLGLMTSGFPNLFTVTGPGSPSVLANMIPAIEQHVDWIAKCIEQLEAEGLRVIEAEKAAEDAWVQHVNDVAGFTLYPNCNSWYLGANVPGKPRVFMPYIGFPAYCAKCEEVVAKNYEGFTRAA